MGYAAKSSGASLVFAAPIYYQIEFATCQTRRGQSSGNSPPVLTVSFHLGTYFRCAFNSLLVEGPIVGSSVTSEKNLSISFRESPLTGFESVSTETDAKVQCTQ